MADGFVHTVFNAGQWFNEIEATQRLADGTPQRRSGLSRTRAERSASGTPTATILRPARLNRIDCEAKQDHG